MEFMLKRLLLVSIPMPEVCESCFIFRLRGSDKVLQDQMEDEEEWYDDDDVPPLVEARVLALKICRKRCMAHSSSATALDVAQPVLRLFTSILAFSGSATEDAEDEYVQIPSHVIDVFTDIPCSVKVRSRMRLQAAVSLLHLSTLEAYASAIATNFVVLAITIQVGN